MRGEGLGVGGKQGGKGTPRAHAWAWRMACARPPHPIIEEGSLGFSTVVMEQYSTWFWFSVSTRLLSYRKPPSARVCDALSLPSLH